MGLFKKSDREAFGAAAAAFAFLAVLLAFSSLAIAATRDSGSGGGGTGGTGAQIGLSEYKIDPATLTASPDSEVTVKNDGTMPHNLAIEGTDKATKNISPGESVSLALTGLKKGSYKIYCTIPGHESAGMRGTLIIGSGGAVQTAKSGSTGLSPQELLATNAENDKTQGQGVTTYATQLGKIVDHYVKTGQIDPSLYEPDTSYGKEYKALGGNPLLGPPVLTPEIQPDGTKLFKLEAKVVDWEVSPGNVVSVYTYDGMVPGPTMHVDPGDKVAIEVTNHTPEYTSVHFHGVDTPVGMDGVPYLTQDPIKTGKTFTYRFTASDRPQEGMYHSHYHAETQIADGMAGAFIVGSMPVPSDYARADQFPAADTPYVMMLNDAGTIGLALNGKAFPGTSPVVAPVGKWVQLTYMNEGNTVHPMHLHGMPQLVIAKDGEPLANPQLEDTVLVAPGERWTVLIRPTADNLDNLKQTPFAPFGVWAFHCHIIPHAESYNGFIGMTTTFIALPS